MSRLASAGTINIILSDVDVSYLGAAAGNTGSIYDAIAHPGGNLSPAESDVVAAAVFEMDMAPVGTLMTGGGTTLYTDLKIDGVGSTIPLGSLNTVGSNGGGFGLDFFTSAGNSLRLGMNAIDLLVTNNVMFFTGTATVISQNMPFGLQFNASQPIVFSYTATLPGLVGGNPITGGMASGAMTITGTMIPEPTTLATLLVGLALSGVTMTRRRSNG
ncbi:MAG: PEP-CTERM sorting domain-containing protein [Pirellulales bacterium]